MTKYTKILILSAALLAALIVILNTVFKVRETEQVVITQFGKPVGEPKTTPGLKLKIPFIQKVNYFEKRFMEWDGDPNQVPTKDKKFIFVEAYAAVLQEADRRKGGLVEVVGHTRRGDPRLYCKS